MGFLYQVLKDVSEKQPYQVGKETYLKKVLGEISEQLYRGNSGFNIALPKMLSRIGKYNADVQQHNDSVKKPTETFLRRLKNDFPKEIKRIPTDENLKEMSSHTVENAVAPTRELSGKYIQYGNDFDRALQKAKKEISNLNSQCKNNVTTAQKQVKYVTERLAALSTKEESDLKAVENEITETLNSLKDGVNVRVNRDVSELVKLLKDKVSAIWKLLEEIDKKLYEYVDALQKWIDKADKDVNQAISKADGIEQKLPGGKNRDELNRISSELKKRSDVIWEYIGGMKNQIEENVKAALNAVKDMDGKLKEDLYEVREAIKNDMDLINNKVKELGKRFTGIEDGNQNKIAEIVKHIKTKVGSITGHDRSNTGIQQIVSGAFKYSGGFGQGTMFYGTVSNWVDNIVAQNGLVKKRIDEYFVKNEDKLIKSYKNQRGKEAVKQAIKDELMLALTTEIDEAHKSIRVQRDGKVSNNVEYVKQVCNAFAANVERRFSGLNDQMYTLINNITAKVESGVRESRELTDNYYLKRAIESTSSALLSKARQSASEIDSFALLATRVGDGIHKTSIAAEIDRLYGAANELDGALKTAINDRTTSTKPAEDVDKAIAQVMKTLDKQLPETLNGNKVNLQETSEAVFQRYKLQVSQSAESLAVAERDAEKLEGTLPAAIKKIRDDASGYNVTVTKEDLSKWSGEITSNLNSLMSEFSEVGKVLKQQLTKLKTYIGMNHNKSAADDTLQKIKDNLDSLRRVQLKEARKFAEQFLTYAQELSVKYVKRIQEHIAEQTTCAITTLNTDARKHYISTIRELLTDYAQKVQSELSKLPEEIDDDLRRGYKGFVKKIETHLLPGLTIPPNTPLKDAASTLKAKLTAFMEQLQQQADFKKSFETVRPSHTALLQLLQQLSESKHFGHLVPPRVNALLDRLGELSPNKYKEEAQPMLDTLKAGYGAFAEELGKAYVSVYDGARNINWDQANNPETTYCAKIFLTAFATIYDAVHDLRINCNSLKGHQIHSTSDLGRLFLRHGFRVSHGDKQHWELQNKSVINGEYVANRISFRVDAAKDNEHLKKCESNERKTNVLFNLFDILKCLLRHVDQYNAACHIAILPKPRTPCTVFEMLVWLSGLTYTSAYQALLSDGFTNVLDNPDKPLAGDGEITVFDIEQSYLEAHPQKITYKNIRTVLQYLCSKSYDLLTTVVGHGDAATFYACDYSNNTLNLYYPSSGEDCLQMLLDFLRRILQPLRYLFERCSVADKNYGWADCHYGRDVPTTKSHCNIKPTDDVTCLPNCQPNCKPNCQPTSPLMNYLSDSLLGYLPHRLESVGCKSKCSTCPSTSRLGMPCVTPLGFRAFSGSTKTGRQLCEIIREFLGSGVVSSLFGLSPTPPKTLPEHFSFGLSLVNKWVKVASYITDAGIKPVSQTKIEASIQTLSIKLCTDTGKLTNVLRDAYGSSQHEHQDQNHLEVYADVSSLCMTRSCTDRDMRCAPYLSTLCSDTYQYLVHKNFATYLTWAVYLPWDFWNQLNNLCNAFKNIFCQDWGCHTCLRAEKCKRGQHGLVEKVENQPDKPHCNCPSMVQCKGVSATLYQFGFCFGNAATLNNEASAKKCSDFCSQLDKVLKSEYFVKLFKECDIFIWTIREPFTYLVLALWSLSLFYLICVMVGRLDVLHIRSHLRSPSSHRITAQSLLAAAQVGRLAKISYLQP
ncbi:hypothetical protein, conserved [Babesia bigemina]|uniref:C3H1-type domain-containing protein n=1 Tax=Babesia bigemina TaxID=5866 RepID=A0A061BTS6_BABBI|nr:hypothetical protein, conserved [Babesia bigemina]CDR71884.1 hypothetical protein, conserved [Babesia bigemina]|eukprot:XP_012770826.1 hypothetical protein, conserved [Babesia bigemina]